MRPQNLLTLLLAFPATSLVAEASTAKVDFATQVKPILESACVSCHRVDEAKGDIMLHTKADAMGAQAEELAKPVITPGKPEESALIGTLSLADDDDLLMPPTKNGGRLSKEQIDILTAWVKDGAPWPDGVELKSRPRINFAKVIKPLFEQNCLSCHNADKSKGDYIMVTRKQAMESGENGGNLVPFNAAKSGLLALVSLPKDDDDLMPPTKSGGPLTTQQIEQVKLWIEEGAVWPDSVKLEAKERVTAGNTPEQEMEVVRRIHEKIVSTSKEAAATDMKPYTGKSEISGIAYEMLPIPAGQFTLGSPSNEPMRKDDEGPQVKVVIKPFWMGKNEITWDEYQPFMITSVDRNKDGSRKQPPPHATLADAVSQPTTPYQEMSFGMGVEGYPAISMTQHAANKYCEWLSAQTGHFYRLPTEAEWEYACRAGTTTAYSFGDDASKLSDYGWFFDNSDGTYQKVGQKKPNPWGLHDMHGNVIEWTLDQYAPEYYKSLKDGVVEPWNKSTKAFPHSARGGSWDDDPDQLRSAARRGSREQWKVRDPQLPKSIWYLTDAQFLGFRIIRPLEIPSVEEMYEFWNSGLDKK